MPRAQRPPTLYGGGGGEGAHSGGEAHSGRSRAPRRLFGTGPKPIDIVYRDQMRPPEPFSAPKSAWWLRSSSSPKFVGVLTNVPKLGRPENRGQIWAKFGHFLFFFEKNFISQIARDAPRKRKFLYLRPGSAFFWPFTICLSVSGPTQLGDVR